MDNPNINIPNQQSPTPTPQGPQAEPPKPSFFSLLTVRLAIFAIAIALIGGGVYYFLNRSVQKSSVMQELTIERCDVDQNGKCDEKDKQIVEGFIGICRQDTSYNPIVDADADGCITVQDSLLLFPNEPYTAPADKTANSKTSPDGSYYVTEEPLGDYNKIAIYTKGDKLVTEDLIAKNNKEIGYGVKFQCQCGTSFKQWINDAMFSIKIVNANGEEFEFNVDAATGKVDESSFKKIR